MFRNLGGRFSEAPQANIKRSIFGLKHTHKTTFDAGDLVPIYCSEVLPGDTFDINLTSLVRLATPLHPTMDNLFLDTYFFFVPNRLIWDNFTKFMGENDEAWAQDTDGFVPPFMYYGSDDYFDASKRRFGSCEPGSVLNYLGIPIFAQNSKKQVAATILDFNCYVKIFNDWFRDENLQDEVPMYKGDGNVPKTYLDSYKSYLNTNFGVNVYPSRSGSCLKVARFHDYFSSALPAPQKGPDVLIPAGGEVLFSSDSIDSSVQAQWMTPSGTATTYNGQVYSSGGTGRVADNGGNRLFYDPQGTLRLDGLEITVNNLRLAIQTQKLLEADARGGWARA